MRKRQGIPWASPVRITRPDGSFEIRRALTYGQRRNLARTGLPDQRAPIPKKLRQTVLERDGYRCVYCGTDKGPFQLDHVRPYSKGGWDMLTNLVTACVPCNQAKRDSWSQAE